MATRFIGNFAAAPIVPLFSGRRFGLVPESSKMAACTLNSAIVVQYDRVSLRSESSLNLSQTWTLVVL